MKPTLLEAWRLSPLPSTTWSQQDVVLVTGGAKGITAACAFEFAARTGVQLVLCGRSAAQTAEIQSALNHFLQCGVRAEYLQCDVTSAESTTELIRYCVQKYGPHFSGIVHGAGINIPARANALTLDQVLHQLRPKIIGYLNLWSSVEALQAQQHLKLFACLSSIIGVGGFEGSLSSHTHTHMHMMFFSSFH
jgi:NAD(P)-dependent dehydrogenase (short-subunit alcohol dehydrogenase family)